MDPKFKMYLVSGSACVVIATLLILLEFLPENPSKIVANVPKIKNQKTLHTDEISATSKTTLDGPEYMMDEYCGPLKVKVSEEDDCYWSNGSSVICPTYSYLNTNILKKCKPRYGEGYYRMPHVTYTCTKEGWFPQYDGCHSDCGLLLAEDNKYSWIAAIYSSDEKLVCTGTIITSFHVLTAASCFDVEGSERISIKDPENYTIIVGEHYINIHKVKESAQVRKVKHSIVHEYYDASLENYDLALIEVDKEFVFNRNILPACLDWNNFYEELGLRNGNEAALVGWEYHENEEVPCKETHVFNVQYWQRPTCLENFPIGFPHERFSSEKICGFYFDEDSNCGKSKGVGLFFKNSFWRYYLKGITNYIYSSEGTTHILFTKVSLFNEWLWRNVNKHASISPYYNMTIDMVTPLTETGCKLPEHVKYGKFKMVFGNAYVPKTWVPSTTRIILSCVGDEDEASTTIRCELGEWIPTIDKLECKRPGSCQPLPSSASEDVLCRLNGQETSCIEPVNNTTAVVRCKPFHIISGNTPIYKCQDGEWDQSFTRCTLECGKKSIGVTTLTIGGSETMENEYPWVVAIYRFTELVCGGTIISRRYVLSAAHCFTNSKGVAKSKEPYTIIAGKHYRSLSTVERFAQSRKIKSLSIHDDYKGKLHNHRDDIALIELDAELTPTLEVQPACVDWDSAYEDFDFVDGNNGVVAGWGYTKENSSPSAVLRKLVIPFRPKNVCVEKLPADFSEQYVVTDKICAGFEDNNMNVCKGDSGGGLYFKSPDNRFYVRGIVSLTVKTRSGGCTTNKFALYTKVSQYLPWMEAITRRVL